MDTEKYFENISEETEKAYKVARKARKQSKDPEQRVDVPVATDLASKASSLVIAAKFQELEDSGVAERIRELEDEFGKNDERVSFSIAREIAEGNFHDFKNKERACDAGVRVGVSYMTGGITTAPLEGIGDVKIRTNDDGSKYLSVYYSGPIRSAGGTASAMSVLLADYVRLGVGLDEFKPSETVIERYATEVEDYYNRVTAKQYNPTREETKMIADNVPVEVTGSPTEDLDVSNYKDLDRVETNKIRGGMCLVYLDGLPLKAPKIKKRIEKWGADFGLEHWKWVEEYLDLQKEIHSSDDSDGEEKETKYAPSDKYLGSLTAGRPILAHPGRKGGFRVRYGHSRTNGLAAVSFHPATMEITQRFVAVGTQLKVEYPGKATVGTPCDSIEPPVVRLNSGKVVKVETREQAKELEKDIEEILFLGDMLVTYGEFVENGKKLLPSPYVEEWWEKELEKALKEKEMELGRDFSERAPNPEEALKISEALDIKFHPKWTPVLNDTEPEEFKHLYLRLKDLEHDKDKAKSCLEDLLIPHSNKLEIDKQWDKALEILFDLKNDYKDAVSEIQSQEDIIDFVHKVSGLETGRQSTHYIGARMGRPEKAEKRSLTGKPQLLFPCGKKEGGRMRNLSASYEQGTVREQIIHNRCTECEEITHYAFCRECDAPANPVWFCTDCGKAHDNNKPSECKKCGNERFNRYKTAEIDVKTMMDEAMENLGIDRPELLKSFRGMTSKHKHVEPIEKGLLRQKYGLYVNKDATVRYDALDLPISHFKPKEIQAPVEKLQELGYTEDVNGEPLESEDQVVALKPQDIVIPRSEKSTPASDYFANVAQFIDELLEKFYGLEPFYQLESPEDLIGQLVIGLAPHTSGGTVGRIIGFTDAKGIYAHPYWHAAKRRNCDGDEDAILLLMDGLLNFSRDFLPDMTGARSVTKDTRIVARVNGEIRVLRADELVDNVLENEGYETRSDGFEVCREFKDEIEAVSFDDEGNVSFEPVSALIRHENDKEVFEVKTSRGQISVTGDHSVFVTKGDRIEAKPVRDLEEGECVIVPGNPDFEAAGLPEKLDLFQVLDDEECYIKVPEHEKEELRPEIEQNITSGIKEEYGSHNVHGYKTWRKSAPLKFYKDVGVVPSCKVKLKANSEPINRRFDNCNQLYRLLGYLLSEDALDRGEIYNTDKQIIQDVIDCIEELTGITPEVKEDVREDRKTCYSVSVPATFMRALEQLGLKREKFDCKSVPSFVFGAEREQIRHFVDAYRAGDGSIYEEKGFSKLYTRSGEMATQLTLLVRKLGFKSSTRLAGDTWEILYSEWSDKDPYWPLWETLDEIRTVLREEGYSNEEIKRELANYRTNNRVKTASKEKVEELFEKGVSSLSKPVQGDISVERVKDIEKIDYGNDYVYDLEVPGNQNFLCGPHPIFAHNTMDAPLILSTVLNPDEVDDEAWAIETVSEYPLEFYYETQEYKQPWNLDCDIEIGEDVVHSDEAFKHGYTHETSDINDGPQQSEYVTLDEMSEKTKAQLGLSEKIRAADENDAAELLLQKHFLPDIRGNLRSFSKQQMRCVNCNEKFRRVPMTNQTIAPTGKTTAQCPECDGKVLLTISEGTIKKYMQPSKDIVEHYEISPYMRQQVHIINRSLQGLFGKDQRQSGLKQFT